MSAHPSSGTILRRLRLVRWVGVVDTLLLAWLLYASLTHDRGLVQVLGPVHGVGFLLLLLIAAVAAYERLWGWWFPAAILVTGGPIGALVGDWMIVRRLRNTVPDVPEAPAFVAAPGEPAAQNR